MAMGAIAARMSTSGYSSQPKPKTRKLGQRPLSGTGRASTVSKVRRTKLEVYGTKASWQETTAEVKKRDGYKCVDCGSIHNLEVHHTMAASRGGKTQQLYLKTLCDVCHSKQPGHKHLKARLK